MKPTQTTAPRPAHELADLTRRYARFSRSAGGLASVLGGLLALVAYLLGGLMPPDSLGGRGALAAAPFVWILVKELLRRGYYQRLGRVREIRTRAERRFHLGLTLFTALVSTIVVVTVLSGSWGGGMAPPGSSTLGYMAMVAAMPFLVWRFMTTPLEFVVGVFLVAQAALMLAGSHYALWEQPQVPLAALALVVIGVKQHREFLELKRLLEAGDPHG